MGKEFGRRIIDEARRDDVVTKEMVLSDYHRWREISGSKLYTMEQADRAFEDFAFTRVRFTGDLALSKMEIKKQDEELQVLFEATAMEHIKRQSYRSLLATAPQTFNE